jgi:putative addiction module component (TIGR02574 family)
MEERITSSEIKKLSVAERILLVEEIWDSIAAEQEILLLTDGQREELDRRIASYNESPKKGATWDEIKKRLKASQSSRVSMLRQNWRFSSTQPDARQLCVRSMRDERGEIIKPNCS